MDFYRVSDEDKAKIKTKFNVSDNDVKNQMNTLKEWVKTMSQFPKYTQDSHFLFAVLVRCKFKKETAQIYIENYFKGIIKYPKIFQNLGKLKPSEALWMIVPFPNLTQNFERVIIFRLIPENLATQPFEMRQVVLMLVTTAVFLYNHDDAVSVRFLVDLKGFTAMNLFKVNAGIADIFRMMSIILNVLKLRISGIDFINSSKLVYGLIAIAKLVLKPKLYKRITVHNDIISSLSKNVPMKSLPNDYGGQCESVADMLEKWDQTVEEQQHFFQAVADWSQVKNVNDNYDINKT